MPKIPDHLITYCTNIHPGESWDETFAALREHIPAIKGAVSPERPFPIGLRLSNRAATELAEKDRSHFKAWLDEQDCFIPTINGFPFGSFHGTRIKEQVYLPDWRSAKRAEYTIRLATLLADWLPQGVAGSISTVPIGFGNAIELAEIKAQLESVLSCLASLYDEQGTSIMLALEPEPGCLIETTEDICEFFSALALPNRLRQHLGMCYDCCHQAVEFEDPVDSFMRLAAANVPIAKVQVSSALRVKGKDSLLLRRFDEPCYLHQVVSRGTDGSVTRYADLSEALLNHSHHNGDEWRCHFHLPIFHPGSGAIGTTRDFLIRFLPLVRKDILLEIETYTWDILPDDLRGSSVTNSIIREIRWVQELLHA